MNKRISSPLDISSPSPFAPQTFDDPVEAVDALTELYERNTHFLVESFATLAKGAPITSRYRAFYPQVSIETTSYGHIDTRLSYGHVTAPGIYTTTITRPQLFRHYLKQQLGLLMRNHNVPVVVSESTTPIPLHFAFGEGAHVEASAAAFMDIPMRDLFDTPDLNTTDDEIANGEYIPPPGEPSPLAAFTAQRIDYSLARLAHYTATGAQHFQNFVLFTNYQFYIDEFCIWARKLMAEGGDGYTAFVEPGNVITHAGSNQPETDVTLSRLPQMPAYHLKKKGHAGITMINIGVGPSNAKTITDHVAVLRPHAWLMLGHCAGLRNSQRLGDYVLAHAYMREDHVLDDDLPVWVPIPALAEVQVALEGAVAEITGYEGFELRVARPARPGQASVPGSCHRARHGIGDDRRKRLPLPRALRHPALRIGQAVAWRIEAARHGDRLLQDAGQPASANWYPCDPETRSNAAGSTAFAQAQKLLRNGLPIGRFPYWRVAATALVASWRS
jgi:AMP nucleosidase